MTFKATGILSSNIAFYTRPKVPDPIIYKELNLFQSNTSIPYYKIYYLMKFKRSAGYIPLGST